MFFLVCVLFQLDSLIPICLCLHREKQQVSISQLTKVSPKDDDRALAFSGDYKGSEGTMDGIDGEDTVLKVIVDGDTDYYIVPMSELVKLADW